MTGVRITVSDRQVQGVLRQLARLGREPRGFLGPIGMQIIGSTRERAQRGVAPDGTPWAPLNPDYAATKRGGHMLRESGNLLGSLTREVDGGRLMVGTSRIYAAIHQFGGEIAPRRGKRLAFRMGGATVFARRVRIPARPWLGISRDDVQMIEEEFADFVARATRRP